MTKNFLIARTFTLMYGGGIKNCGFFLVVQFYGAHLNPSIKKLTGPIDGFLQR